MAWQVEVITGKIYCAFIQHCTISSYNDTVRIFNFSDQSCKVWVIEINLFWRVARHLEEEEASVTLRHVVIRRLVFVQNLREDHLNHVIRESEKRTQQNYCNHCSSIPDKLWSVYVPAERNHDPWSQLCSEVIEFYPKRNARRVISRWVRIFPESPRTIGRAANCIPHLSNNGALILMLLKSAV